MPLGERALAWIDKYLAEARPLLLGAEETASPLLFVTGRGRAVHANQLSSQVRQFMNQAGITKLGACHLFRHTAATLMLDHGADIRHIQAILGHDNLSTTQIYTHVSIGKLCEVHAKTHPGRLLRPPREDDASAAVGSPPRPGLLERLRRLIDRLRGTPRGTSES